MEGQTHSNDFSGTYDLVKSGLPLRETGHGKYT